MADETKKTEDEQLKQKVSISCRAMAEGVEVNRLSSPISQKHIGCMEVGLPSATSVWTATASLKSGSR